MSIVHRYYIGGPLDSFKTVKRNPDGLPAETNINGLVYKMETSFNRPNGAIVAIYTYHTGQQDSESAQKLKAEKKRERLPKDMIEELAAETAGMFFYGLEVPPMSKNELKAVIGSMARDARSKF
jgi:hypothetical protein